MARTSLTYKIGKPYWIKWRDHHVPSIKTAWVALSDIKHEDCIISTLGFAVWEDSNFVCLAMSVGDGEDLSDKDATVGAPMKIAKASIVEVMQIQE